MALAAWEMKETSYLQAGELKGKSAKGVLVTGCLAQRYSKELARYEFLHSFRLFSSVFFPSQGPSAKDKIPPQTTLIQALHKAWDFKGDWKMYLKRYWLSGDRKY